ncbi:MAG TPA: TerD family protein [bacterium]|nr:TerD family protein [bacterium]
MAISLEKGQRIDIGLSKVRVGLGWDANPADTGSEFDLDASAFMLNGKRKIPQEGFFVFYNNPCSPDGAVSSSGDDRTGRSSEGDDETLTVDLTKISREVQEIVFVATIHDAESRKQNFGQVPNSYIRIYDAMTNEEICKYELGEDFSVETGVEFGRLYMKDGRWRFEATGTGYKGGLETFLGKYA